MAGSAQSARRPVGLTVLSLILLLCSLGSLEGIVRLFPMWVASVRQHHYASYPSLWVQFVLGLSGLATAYGFWYRRRWSRIPFLIYAIISAVTFSLIIAFGAAEFGARVNWVVLGAIIVLVLTVIWLVTRYVWRNT